MSGEPILGDCLDAMAAMEPASVDAIVTDPPYGLEFMGKEWDKLGATVEHPDDGEGPWGRTKRVRYGSSAASMQEWHRALSKRALAIQHGAVSVSVREVALIIRRRLESAP